MSLPAGVATVTLTGTYTDATGAPAAGWVTITPDFEVVDATDRQLIYPAPVQATLDASGHFTVTLVASDAANVSPANFTYQVSAHTQYHDYAPIHVLLPQARPSVDVSELVSVQPSGTVIAPQNVLSVNGHTGAVSLSAADVGADPTGAATAAQTNAQAYTDTKTLVAKKATGAVNVTLTDPQAVPILESQFVAKATTVRLSVRVCGRGAGVTGGTMILGVCDSTLGRRPRPSTQAEANSAPAGITYYYLGVIAPSALNVDLTKYPQGQGNQATVYRDVILTGLTVGHTYFLDVTATIVGGADTAPLATGLHAYSDYMIDVVPTTGGTNKVYVGYGINNAGTQVVNVTSTLPYKPPTLGVLIPGSGYVQHVRATPDGTKVLVASYITATNAPLYVINTATDTITATYNLTDYVSRIAVAPNSATAWLARQTSKTVVPMTIATGALGTPITLTGTPVGVAVSPDGSAVWVCQSAPNVIRTFHTADGSSAGADITLPNGYEAYDIVFTPDGTKAYVTASGAGGGYVHEINTATRTVTRSLQLTAANVGLPTLAIFPGDTPRTLLVWSNAVQANSIYQVDILDWTVYVTWGCLTGGNAGFSWGRLTSTGDILAGDFTNAKLDYWLGGSVALDNSSANTFLHEGEGVEITCTPAT